jgi:hypothetical protein
MPGLPVDPPDSVHALRKICNGRMFTYGFLPRARAEWQRPLHIFGKHITNDHPKRERCMQRPHETSSQFTSSTIDRTHTPLKGRNANSQIGSFYIAGREQQHSRTRIFDHGGVSLFENWRLRSVGSMPLLGFCILDNSTGKCS